ncbi:hypothetical protein WM11_31310 [Burkholderia ubonensis]|nr:hypothetical protein WL46_24365 [Burkholderia ubonensis]KWK13299.1 hypothetical protein WM11_31310 [Burkholderia ubonensis]KWK37145.1 hypothetical protein WM13_24850 [Burkholderia ubonensis]
MLGGNSAGTVPTVPDGLGTGRAVGALEMINGAGRAAVGAGLSDVTSRARTFVTAVLRTMQRERSTVIGSSRKTPADLPSRNTPSRAAPAVTTLLQCGPRIEEAHQSSVEGLFAVGFDFIPDEFAPEVPVKVIENRHPPAGLPVEVHKDLCAIVEQFVRQQFRLHTNGSGCVHHGDHACAVKQRVFRPQFFDVQRHEVPAPM